MLLRLLWRPWLLAAVMLFVTAPLQRAEAVRIGLLLPLSGPMAAAGAAARTGFEMAAESTEPGGGSIAVHIADTAGSSEGGRAAAMRLIRKERVAAMAGGLSSPAAASAAAVAEASGVPLLICGAASAAVTDPPYRFVFRINPPVDGKYAALASFLDRFVPSGRSAAVFCEDLAPAEALSEQWLARSTDLGLDPIFRIRFSPGLVDFRPDLAKARVKKPALMVLIAAPADAAMMMDQRRSLNLAPKLILGEAPGAVRPEFGDACGGACESMCALVPWAASVALPGVRAFSQSYRDRYGTLPGHHEAFGYAALNVLVEAVSRARQPGGAALRDALAETDTTTICGRVRFDPQGDRPGQNRAPWLLVQWQSGRLETVWPQDRASAEPLVP